MKGRSQIHWDLLLSAEIKLRAERRAGEILAGMEKQHGARLTTGFHDVRTLSDLGISKLQSHRWQAVAHHVLELCSIVFRTQVVL